MLEQNISTKSYVYFYRRHAMHTQQLISSFLYTFPPVQLPFIFLWYDSSCFCCCCCFSFANILLKTAYTYYALQCMFCLLFPCGLISFSFSCFFIFKFLEIFETFNLNTIKMRFKSEFFIKIFEMFYLTKEET